MDVTEVHSDLRVQCEAPGRLHLASWVPAEIVTPPELRVFLGQAMTMRVLSAPWLTVMTWFGDANCAPVVSSTSIVACLVWGRVCKTDSLCQSTNHELMCFEYLAIDSGDNYMKPGSLRRYTPLCVSSVVCDGGLVAPHRLLPPVLFHFLSYFTWIEHLEVWVSLCIPTWTQFFWWHADPHAGHGVTCAWPWQQVAARELQLHENHGIGSSNGVFSVAQVIFQGLTLVSTELSAPWGLRALITQREDKVAEGWDGKLGALVRQVGGGADHCKSRWKKKRKIVLYLGPEWNRKIITNYTIL